MKKTLCAILALALCLSLALTGCGGTSAPPASSFAPAVSSAAPEAKKEEQKPVKITVADTFADTHIFAVNDIQVFMAAVEKRTNGAVTFEYYPGSQLGAGADMLDLLEGELADMVFVGPSYLSGTIPLSTVMGLPNLYPDVKTGALAYLELSRGILMDEELGEFGLHSICAAAYSPYLVATAKEVSSIDSLKGMRIRGSGATQELAISSLGATCVNLKPNEIYEALQRGTIDGQTGPIEGMDQFKTQEVVSCVISNVSVTGWAGSWCVPDRIWEQLTEETKEIFLEEGYNATKNLADYTASAIEGYIKDYSANNNVKFVELSAEEVAKAEADMATVEAAWIESLKGYGYANAEDLLKQIKDVIAKVEAAS